MSSKALRSPVKTAYFYLYFPFEVTIIMAVHTYSVMHLTLSVYGILTMSRSSITLVSQKNFFLQTIQWLYAATFFNVAQNDDWSKIELL